MLGRFFKKQSKGQESYCLPEGLRVYAFGDIHGLAEELADLWAKVSADAARYDGPIRYIFLGDYIDRGPSSKQVLEMLFQLSQQHDCIFLRGNHEQALLDFLAKPSRNRAWLDWGGREALASFGIKLPSDQDALPPIDEIADNLRSLMPAAMYDFIDAMPFKHREGGFFFAHAGIAPGTRLDRQNPSDLMTIRYEFINSRADHGARIVHGHTPVDRAEIHRNRINLDSGGYMTGRLTAARIEADEVVLLTNAP